MKFQVSVFVPMTVSFGAIANRGPFQSIERATEFARKETRKQSIINGRSYATIKQFSPSIRDYVDVGTIYSEKGTITDEQADYFPSF